MKEKSFTMKRFILFNTITMQKLLYLLVFVTLHISVTAQDTIYPYEPGYPFYADSVQYFWETSSGYPFYFNRIFATSTVFDRQVTVTGLAIAGVYNSRDDNFNHRGNPAKVWGVLATVNGDDYSHATVHYTRPRIIQSRWPTNCNYDSCYINVRYTSFCSNDTEKIDEVYGAYLLYFDEPITISDTVYLSMFATDYQDTTDFIAFCVEETPYCLGLQNWPWKVIAFDLDSAHNPTFVQYTHGVYRSLICPIFTVPDTDSFSCPEVEGFGFAGMMAGSPVFAWDTAAEHGLYQLAYGPYDMPLDSLRIAETGGRYIELFDNSLSQDVYYQARLRAQCHHRCPIHDTVMWTAWTDPVYFYTGNQMPDTTHHSEPEGIAEAGGQAAFVLAPNPAHGSMTLTLEGMPADGTVLTIHDGAGREVLRRVLSERVTRIETEGWAAGVYTVTVSTPRGMTTRRLSVE